MEPGEFAGQKIGWPGEGSRDAGTLTRLSSHPVRCLGYVDSAYVISDLGVRKVYE